MSAHIVQVSVSSDLWRVISVHRSARAAARAARQHRVQDGTAMARPIDNPRIAREWTGHVVNRGTLRSIIGGAS